jgi:hypothetical protein
MINKWEQWLHHWGFTEEDEQAFTHYMVTKYPTAAVAGLSETRTIETPPVLLRAVQAVADVYGFSLEQLAAPGRKREVLPVMRCRATIIDILNSKTFFNLGRPEISNRFLGGRDNSTVIYTWRTYLKLDQDYYEAVIAVCTVMGVHRDETLASLEAERIARDSKARDKATTSGSRAGEAGA